MPELSVLVIGPVAATAADRARLSTWQRTACICVCQPLLILAYLLLLLGSAPQGPPPSGAGAVATGAAVDKGLTQWVDAFPASMSGVPPSVPLGLLGISWGVSHALFWGLLPTACPPQSLAIGSGLLGVALNVGPTLFPLALASFVPGPVPVGPGPGPGPGRDRETQQGRAAGLGVLNLAVSGLDCHSCPDATLDLLNRELPCAARPQLAAPNRGAPSHV